MSIFSFLSPKKKQDPMDDLLEKQRKVTDQKRQAMKEIMDMLRGERRVSSDLYSGPERRELRL